MLEKSTLKDTARCYYGRERTKTTENGAIVKEDATMKSCNKVEKTNYTLDVFYLMK
jgi:hypothetical protein